MIKTIIKLTLYLAILIPWKSLANSDTLKDNDKAAAIAYNYCIVSLTKMNENKDILTCTEEIDNIVNNLNLRKITDKELKETFKAVMAFSQDVKINKEDEKFVDEIYALQMKQAFYSSFPDPIVILSPDPRTLALNAIQVLGGAYLNFQQLSSQSNLDLRQKKWKLEKALCEDLEYTRFIFIDTAYNVFNERQIPDKFRLTEKQVIAFLEDLSIQDLNTRYKRLMLKSQDFQAYPPFWYWLGVTAYQLGKPDVALKSFEVFDNIYEGILRNDPFATGVSMTRVTILMEEPLSQKNLALIQDDLTRIKLNSWETDWSNFLFCAIAYGELNQPKEARKNIERNKIYFSKLGKEAKTVTKDTELLISVQERNIDKLKRLLQDINYSTIYDYLYVYTALPNIHEINKLINKKTFIVEHSKYIGCNPNKWLSSVFQFYCPSKWITDATVITMNVGNKQYPSENLKLIKKTGKYKMTFIVKEKTEETAEIQVSFTHPKINAILTFKPIFTTKSSGEEKFSHYTIKALQLNNKHYSYDSDKEYFRER
jgi:tetratricopeptide (TPR) repeat protein